MSATPRPRIPPAVLRAAAAHQRILQQCREDPYTFAQHVARDANGNPIDMSWAGHHQWWRHLNYCWQQPVEGRPPQPNDGAGLRCVILAAMGHGKTSGFSLPLVAWLIGCNPNVRIKVICAGDVAAKERVDAVQTLITSPAYRRVFPHIRPGRTWGKGGFTVLRDPKIAAVDQTLQGSGVLSKGLGGRCDYLIFDDVCDPANSATDEQRNKIRHRVMRQWMTRLDSPHCPVLYIATPWHAQDLTMELCHTTGWGALVQRARGLEQGCDGFDSEVTINGRPGQVLPPYPHVPGWQPGQPWPNSRGLMEALEWIPVG